MKPYTKTRIHQEPGAEPMNRTTVDSESFVCPTCKPMNRVTTNAQAALWKAAVERLHGVRAVMVDENTAADLIRTEGFVAIVTLRSGPLSGKTREYAATRVRPAASFETISDA